MAPNPTDPTGKTTPGDQNRQTTPGNEERQQSPSTPPTGGQTSQTPTWDQRQKESSTARREQPLQRVGDDETETAFNEIEPGIEKPDMPHKHEIDPIVAGREEDDDQDEVRNNTPHI